MNIGELFVALGFDVDDTKLKEFNEKIVAGRNELLKISAVASGALYALDAFAENSVNNAVALRNLTNEVGANGEAVSKWQALVRATNPAMSAEEALASYKHLSDYLRDASLGKGAGALNMLGVDYQAGDERDPERVRKALQAAIPLAAQRLSPSQLAGFITDIMGTAGVLNALRTSDADAESLTAGRYRTQAQLDELAKLGDKLNDVNIQWENFKSRMTVRWAPDAISQMDEIQKKIENFIPTIEGVTDSMNTWEKVGAAILAYYSITWTAGMLGALGRVVAAYAAPLAIGAAAGVGIMEGTGWGQDIADIIAPMPSLDEIRAGLKAQKDGKGFRDVDENGNEMDYNIDAMMAAKKSATSGFAPTVNSTNSLTQHINSTADAEIIGAHAARLWAQEQQRRDSGIYIQLNQGPNY